ncbi:MAG: pentapeptide repeat-containing protein, partial [Alphaproteobacteria bacterium]
IVHHTTILLDILLLIWFFRRQRPSGDSGLRWLSRRGRFVLPALVLGFNFAWCRVPSAEATTVGAGKWEALTQEVRRKRSVETGNTDPDIRGRLAIAALRQPVDLLLCPHVGLGCRYLSVPGRTLVGKVWDNGAFVQLRAGEELDGKRRAAFDPLVLQNKRLRFANLSRTQFFNVVLSGADLRGATLDGAFMQQAQLNGAQLQGASLIRAQLQGASLDRAQLQDAWLVWAQLQGASLSQAQLQGASLEEAQLQGARLWEAQLQGASLEQAELQGASLNGAHLQGALLLVAQLRGAMLIQAQLQGASLYGAQLQGASLDGAQLQGAMLDRTQLQGALIADAQIWRLRAPGARLDDAQLRDLQFSDAPPCPDEVRPGAACPNPRSWAGWIEEWTKSIPEGDLRDAARRSFAILTAEDQPAGAETAQGTWRNHPPSQPEAVAKRLGDLACGARDASHIARGIGRQILREQPRNLGTQRQTLAARMLSADCPGAKDLTEDLRYFLRAIAAGRD